MFLFYPLSPNNRETWKVNKPFQCTREYIKILYKKVCVFFLRGWGVSTPHPLLVVQPLKSKFFMCVSPYWLGNWHMHTVRFIKPYRNPVDKCIGNVLWNGRYTKCRKKVHNCLGSHSKLIPRFRACLLLHAFLSFQNKKICKLLYFFSSFSKVRKS